MVKGVERCCGPEDRHGEAMDPHVANTEVMHTFRKRRMGGFAFVREIGVSKQKGGALEDHIFG